MSIEGYDREVERDCDCVTFGDPTKLRALAVAVDEYDRALAVFASADLAADRVNTVNAREAVYVAAEFAHTRNAAVIAAARALVQEPKP